MSAIATRAFAPAAPTLPLLRLRLAATLAGTGRLLAGLLPWADASPAHDAALGLELRLLGRGVR